MELGVASLGGCGSNKFTSNAIHLCLFNMTFPSWWRELRRLLRERAWRDVLCRGGGSASRAPVSKADDENLPKYIQVDCDSNSSDNSSSPSSVDSLFSALTIIWEAAPNHEEQTDDEDDAFFDKKKLIRLQRSNHKTLRVE